MNEKYTVGVGTPIKNYTETDPKINAKSAEIGAKFDDDKTRMDLLMCGCAKALEQVAKVLTFGAKKYADDNWRLVANAKKRYTAALHRHLSAHYQGQQKDNESNLDHLAHALCCLIFLYEFELDNK